MIPIHQTHPWARRGPTLPPVLEETDYWNRREVLKALGLGGALTLGSPVFGCQEAARPVDAEEGWRPAWKPAGGAELYPAQRNPSYSTVDRPLTPEAKAGKYNNFYEFFPDRAGPVYRFVGDFVPRPWSVSIGGLVEEERTVDIDELARIAPLEERIYRFRCVEAWSMVVPWTGIPMKDFVAWCKPRPEARYVRFVTFGPKDLTPEQQKHSPPGFELSRYPWPYYEGLRMDEALHPLTLLVTGIYGHGLPMQHGAPVRVIVPWKYGYKSPKSIVRIEFVKDEPGTFWSDLQPREYPFLSNVEPAVPHPRWSQATERDLATGDRIPTQPYNGYAEEVQHLYAG